MHLPLGTALCLLVRLHPLLGICSWCTLIPLQLLVPPLSPSSAGDSGSPCSGHIASSFPRSSHADLPLVLKKHEGQCPFRSFTRTVPLPGNMFAWLAPLTVHS